VQCQDCHISTCFNKDTRKLFMLCILCFVPVIYSYLFIYLLFVYCYLLFIYWCSLFIIVVHLFCSLFDFSFTLLFDFVRFRSSSIPLLSLFIVHCSKEKNSILILDCIPGISILNTTSSMRVNKHQTAEGTDFVLE
jgi:hypothetical protein